MNKQIANNKSLIAMSLVFVQLCTSGCNSKPSDPPAVSPKASTDTDNTVVVSEPQESSHLFNSTAAVHNMVWSPDGLLISYLSDETGFLEVWIKNADGSDPYQLTDQGGVAYSKSSWSPSGQQLAFISDAGGESDCNVWLVDVNMDLASPSVLTSQQHEVQCGWQSGVSWHPKGTHITFVSDSEEGSIKTINLKNKTVKTILSGEAGYRQVAWSPDGKKLAFSSNRSGDWDVWTYEPSTDLYSRITDRPGEQFQPAWSPDGQMIAFLELYGGSNSIWVTTAQGDHPVQISDPKENTGDVSWSPDGKLLGYTAMHTETDIWTYNLATKQVRRVIAEAHWLAAWSPDAKELAYLKKNEVFGNDIWKLNLATGEHVRLTEDGRVSHNRVAIRWSPDGRFISYTSGIDKEKDLWLLPANGGQSRAVTMDNYEDFWHCWSPDSRYIAYTSKREGHTGLWIVPASGGKARPLLDWNRDYYGCNWSPDGQHIAYWADESIWITDIEGKNPRELAKGFYPLWSQDGAKLFYTYKNKIKILDIASGASTDLMDQQRTFVQNVSPDGKYLLITQYAARQLRTTAAIAAPHADLP